MIAIRPRWLAVVPLLASLACQAGGAATASGVMHSGEAQLANGADARAWTYQLEPYLHLVSLTNGVDLRFGSTGNDYDIHLDGETAVDPSGGLRGEARHASGWGVLLDASYVDPGDDLRAEYPHGGPRVRHGMLEAIVFRRIGDRGLDVFAGLRGWNVQATYTTRTFGGPMENPNRAAEDNWIDPVLGARWSHRLSDRWATTARADVGGFGVGSEFSWTMALGCLYRFNDSLALRLQYRALGVDYRLDPDNTTGLGYDTIIHGPRIGLAFGF